MWEKPSFEELKQSIVDPFNPIGMRMRAAYYLRQEYETTTETTTATATTTTLMKTNEEDGKGEEEELASATTTATNRNTNKEAKNNIIKEKQINIIQVLLNGLINKQHGILMRHEFAYVLGQIRDIYSCTILHTIVLDTTDDIIVRHEAAEALGAIGSIHSIPILQSIINNSKKDNNAIVEPIELVETCQIALDVIEWRNNNTTNNTNNENDMPVVACACMLNPYSSIDPAPAHPEHIKLSVKDIGCILQNNTLPMFERYRAMFSLRNIGTNECIHELCNTLITDTSSVLLRHEISYVLGQLQNKHSIYALEYNLRNVNEHCMVRHESAEALGAIDSEWNTIEKILSEFINDTNDIVRESCLVALDAANYWGYTTSTNDDTPTNEGTCSNDKEEKYDEDNDNDNGDTVVIETQKQLLSLSFAKQKATLTTTTTTTVTAAKTCSMPRVAVLNHHFNVN